MLVFMFIFNGVFGNCPPNTRHTQNTLLTSRDINAEKLVYILPEFSLYPYVFAYMPRKIT